MKRLCAVLLVLTLLSGSAPAQEMTAADRLEQAKGYQAAGRLEDALIALEFAQALAPDSMVALHLHVTILCELERGGEALEMLDSMLKKAPADAALLLMKADVLQLSGNHDDAMAALRRAMVAAGSDEAFQIQYAKTNQDLLRRLAIGETQAKRYDSAQVLLALVPPEEGQIPATDWQPLPGLTREDFDRALGEDRLALRELDLTLRIPKQLFTSEAKRYEAAIQALGTEVSLTEQVVFPEGSKELVQPLSQLYDLVGSYDYLTVSPDGKFLFVITQGVPALFSEDGTLLRLIAPIQTMVPLYFQKRYLRQIFRPEDAEVRWSPDNRYIAMAFPDNTLTKMQLTSNIILMDLENGTAKAIDPELEQHPEAKLTDRLPGGYPVHAAFSADGRSLLYEAFGVLNGEELASELRRYDLGTGQIEVISRYNLDHTHTRGILADTPWGILIGFSSISRSAPRGLAFRSPDGDRLIASEASGTSAQMRFYFLSDAKANTGLLSSDPGDPFAKFFYPFDIGALDASLLNRGYAVRDDLSSGNRLEQIETDKEEYSDDQLQQRLLSEPLVLPHSATLSPDGNYVLMIGRKLIDNKKPVVYITRVSDGMTGCVELPELAESMFGMTGALRWQGGNRLVICLNHGNRLYELYIKDGGH